MSTSSTARSSLRPEPRPRALVAVLLGLLTMGLGHVHAGKVRRAIAATALGAVLVLVVAAASATARPVLLAVALLGAVAVAILVVVDAARQATTGTLLFRQRWQRIASYILYAVVAAGALEIEKGLLRKYWVRNFKVPSSSMEPALLAGDYFVARMGVESQRGDIVVLREPDRPAITVKRVVALGGDTVEISGGTLIVNGRPDSPCGGRAMSAVEIPDGHFFVLGDNRANSLDSRMFGPVRRDSVLGRAVWVYLSLDLHDRAVRWSRVGHRLDREAPEG